MTPSSTDGSPSWFPPSPVTLSVRLPVQQLAKPGERSTARNIGRRRAAPKDRDTGRSPMSPQGPRPPATSAPRPRSRLQETVEDVCEDLWVAAVQQPLYGRHGRSVDARTPLRSRHEGQDARGMPVVRERLG